MTEYGGTGPADRGRGRAAASCNAAEQGRGYGMDCALVLPCNASHTQLDDRKAASKVEEHLEAVSTPAAARRGPA